MADDADDVAEQDVDIARLRRLANHLDPPRAVNEVEEDEPPHVPAGHRPTGDSTRCVGNLSRLDRLAFVPDRRDLCPVGKALGGCGVAGQGLLEATCPVETECVARAGGAQAAVISMILNLILLPRGVTTSIVSPFL